ncbi:MAG: DUF1294 domain-containing protein [Marinomonas sp.]
MSVVIFILLFYVILSLVTFIFYGWDKRAAKRDQHRVPEIRLHWLALLGGWPGAILAQKVFRHKTIKKRFRIIFWLTCLINVLVLILICFFVQVGFIQGLKGIVGLF